MALGNNWQGLLGRTGEPNGAPPASALQAPEFGKAVGPPRHTKLRGAPSACPLVYAKPRAVCFRADALGR